jgi:hypothetical protein
VTGGLSVVLVGVAWASPNVPMASGATTASELARAKILAFM